MPPECVSEEGIRKFASAQSWQPLLDHTSKLPMWASRLLYALLPSEWQCERVHARFTHNRGWWTVHQLLINVLPTPDLTRGCGAFAAEVFSCPPITFQGWLWLQQLLNPAPRSAHASVLRMIAMSLHVAFLHFRKEPLHHKETADKPNISGDHARISWCSTGRHGSPSLPAPLRMRQAQCRSKQSLRVYSRRLPHGGWRFPA